MSKTTIVKTVCFYKMVSIYIEGARAFQKNTPKLSFEGTLIGLYILIRNKLTHLVPNMLRYKILLIA